MVNAEKSRNANPYTQRPIRSVTAFVIIASTVLWIGMERYLAEREYAAYDRLRALGATGDDWVSFKEFITGRPPVVQIDIPESIPVETALEALKDMRNLESITLRHNSFTNDEINSIKRLNKPVTFGSNVSIGVRHADPDVN
jgi:hypothetical protein